MAKKRIISSSLGVRKRPKYISRACQDCKRRKVKCSGEKTCRHCRIRDTPCIYTAYDGRRDGRRSVIQKSDAESTTSDRTEDSIDEEPISRLETEMKFVSSNLKELQRLVRHAIGDKHFRDEQSADLAPHMDHGDTDAFSPMETRPRNLSLSSQLCTIRELVYSNTAIEDKAVTSASATREWATLRRTCSIELPDPQRLRILLDIYFRDLDSFFPFLDQCETESRIYATLKALDYSPEDGYTVEVDYKHHSVIALLCNILGVAESFSSEEGLTEDIRPGWTIFRRGQELTQCFSSLNVAVIDLDRIRYYTLSAEYFMQSEMLQLSSQAISTAIQYAMFARLNEESAWGKCCPEEAEARKKLWWVIYFLDRKIAQRIGCPYLIRDSEVAVSEFKNGSEYHNEINNDPTSIREDEAYMQALIDLARLWSKIWDTFFSATAASKQFQGWRESELMETRIVLAYRELSEKLSWDTDFLVTSYISNGEKEPQIRRRLAIFIRFNLLRLIVKQNPLLTYGSNDREPHTLCVALVTEIVEAIASFIKMCPQLRPSGFFFTSALVECIYHLILVIRAKKKSEDTSRSAVRSLQVSYQLLVEFSKTLDTAKRAVDALHWAMFKSEEFGDVLKVTERVDDDVESGGEVISTLQDSGMASFFAAYPWELDLLGF